MGSLRPQLLYLAAQTLIFFKRHEAALRLLEEFLRERPGHANAWDARGFLLAEQNRLDEAADSFEHALSSKPGNANTLFNLGFVLQRIGRHEDAIARFQQALEASPSLDRAWYGAGLSLIQRGRYREAVEKLTEAARLQPFNPFARYQLAAAWFKLGEPDKVQAEYRRVKGFDPTVARHICEDFGATPEAD